MGTQHQRQQVEGLSQGPLQEGELDFQGVFWIGADGADLKLQSLYELLAECGEGGMVDVRTMYPQRLLLARVEAIDAKDEKKARALKLIGKSPEKGESI